VAEQPGRQIRVGTAEREAAIKSLGEHLSTGHLELAEYTQRVDRAAAARTVAELDTLFVDLPAPHYRPLPPPGMHYPPPVLHSGPPHPAPYGYDQFGRPLSDKSKLAAGLLQILVPIGVGRFYTGDIGIAVAQLLLALLCGVGIIWCIIDGIVILAQGGTDGEGRQLRD
jgi:TM2 domain-containing membrane protein YozV